MADNRICSIDGCGKRAKSRGFCHTHYSRVWRREANRNGRKCTVAGCERKHATHGFCSSHYQRWRRYGDPKSGGNERVAHNGALIAWLEEHASHDGDECLIWPFSSAGSGRSTRCQIRIDGRLVGVCRWLCERTIGPPPTEAHEAAHSCGNGHNLCVNPKHLRWATHTENMHDKRRHGTNGRCSEEQIREIKRLRGTMTQAEIADYVGVSRSVVASVHQGKTWTWVSE